MGIGAPDTVCEQNDVSMYARELQQLSLSLRGVSISKLVRCLSKRYGDPGDSNITNIRVKAAMMPRSRLFRRPEIQEIQIHDN